MRNYCLIAAALIGCTPVQEIEPQTPVVDVEGDSFHIENSQSKKQEPTLEEKLKWITRDIKIKMKKGFRSGQRLIIKEIETTEPYLNWTGPIRYNELSVYMYVRRKDNDLATFAQLSNPPEGSQKMLIFHDEPPYFSIKYAHAHRHRSRNSLDTNNECVIYMRDRVIDTIYKYSKKEEFKLTSRFIKCFYELTNP